MHTVQQIAERSKKIFAELYTVEDILKGNTIEMHEECFKLAQKELEAEDEQNRLDRQASWDCEVPESPASEYWESRGY